MSRQGAGTAVPAPLACPRGRAVPLVLRAPEGPAVGPGCSVCPWAAARPRAVRAASFARRVVSKPGQAPPPPTGTAARPCVPSGPSGALHIGGVGCADVLLGPSNFACNSLGVISNHEFTPLGFQRFLTLLKILPIELHATYG